MCSPVVNLLYVVCGRHEYPGKTNRQQVYGKQFCADRITGPGRQ